MPEDLFERAVLAQLHGDFEEISAVAGVDVLDNTSSALFVDFRNVGVQDLVVLTSARPLYFVNDGSGKFEHKPDAFRFDRSPQGTFTGMSAADYDGDGRVDLYLCSYIYFQSEDQYSYPAPYHDARNGPPNFLFRNQLGSEGGGAFEDVTAASFLRYPGFRRSHRERNQELSQKLGPADFGKDRPVRRHDRRTL